MVVALPKLSAKQIEDFFAELKASDASIARTILNAALDAADPLTTGRRYLVVTVSSSSSIVLTRESHERSRTRRSWRTRRATRRWLISNGSRN